MSNNVFFLPEIIFSAL